MWAAECAVQIKRICPSALANELNNKYFVSAWIGEKKKGMHLKKYMNWWIEKGMHLSAWTHELKKEKGMHELMNRIKVAT